MTALDDAKAIFARAEDAVAHGDHGKALDLFADLVLHPGTTAEMLPTLHWDMAICQAQLGRLDAALGHIGQSGHGEDEFRSTLAELGISTDPAELEARRLFAAGVDAVAHDRYQEALDLFAELAFSPGLPADRLSYVNWNMALCFAALGDWEHADRQAQAGGYDLQEFRQQMAARGISSDPGVADARAQWYEGQAAVQAGDFDRALDIFAGLAFHGSMGAETLGPLHWDMALCCAHLDRWPTAYEHLRAGDQSIPDFEAQMEVNGLHPPGADAP